MQSVSSVSSTTSVTHSRTHTANRATTEQVPDATNTEPADLRSRLEGGEALQLRAEAAGSDSDDSTPNDLATPASAPGPDGFGARVSAGIGALLTRTPAPSTAGPAGSSVSGGPTGRDATRSIEDLASTMAVDSATVRQSIDDGSLSQLLAQNGVQSSIGMLFNTKL